MLLGPSNKTVSSNMGKHATKLPQTTRDIILLIFIFFVIRLPTPQVAAAARINTKPKKLIEKLGFEKMQRENLYIIKQWKELAAAKKTPGINPIHIVVNVLSMTIFPFIASPLLRNRTGMNLEEFNKLMEERKKLIPVWIYAMIKNG